MRKRSLFALIFTGAMALSQPVLAASKHGIPTNIISMDEGLLVVASIAAFLWIFSLFL